MKKKYFSLIACVLMLAMASIPNALCDTHYPPAGTDYLPSTTATIELEIIGMFTETLIVHGPTMVSRSSPYDPGDGRWTIDTEIISMDLVGTSSYIGPITIVESPTRASTGTIKQQIPNVDFPADSFFDVFIEIQTLFGTFHNDDPALMSTIIDHIPPWGAVYTGPPTTIPLRNEQGAIIGFIRHVYHEIVPPWPMYWKPCYPHYAPSGMPDFDQKQDGWNPTGPWTWCAPTAVANSLWWMDSRFHPSNLLTAYGGAVSEHDPSNVIPFITHLAYLMDTDAIRTKPPGAAHSGTWTWDIETGIAQYLSWTGVNPQGDVNGDGKVDATDLAIVTAALGKSPGQVGWNMAADIDPVTKGWPALNLANNIIDVNDRNLVIANIGKSGTFYERTIYAPYFDEVEQEVEKCEDVVLGLGFWQWTGTWVRYNYPYEEGSGHAVTVAGINSTSLKIAISDPDNDAFHDNLIPQGRVPVAHPPYPHGSGVHNNASLVSQDIYNVTLLGAGAPGQWALQGYVGAPPGYFAVVEAAIITSPIGVYDVAVTDVRPKTPGKNKVGQNLEFKINVTVQNQGDFTETFNVTCYANAITVGEQQTTLAPAASTTLIFIWDTTGAPKGNATLSAIADTVPGESDILDNTFIDGIVRVTMTGDCVTDGIIDIFDIALVAVAFGTKIGDTDYNPNADLDCTGEIDIFDIATIAVNFGNKDP